MRTRWFGVAVLGIVFIGAVIRFSYVAHFPSTSIMGIQGDGLEYHLEANRLADGLGYTAALFDAGAQRAHHPPGWVTFLGGLSFLGLDDLRSQQQVGAVLGLLVIIVIALISRRLFGPMSGVFAAAIAALYPGFWVIEAQVLAEPLALVLLGFSIISLYRFSEQASLRRALELGVLLGLTALVKSEQLALLLLAVPVILWRLRTISWMHRALLGAAIVGCVVLLISPWAIYNSTRFDEPVLLSSNAGGALLVGNCRSTFEGNRMGFWALKCVGTAGKFSAAADRSIIDRLKREAAIRNIRNNLDKLPLTIAARYGRAFGLFRVNQTVKWVAAWNGTTTWPVWAWVASFWFVFPLAMVGIFAAVRSKVMVLPLLLPILVSLGVIAVFFGEPRYHTMADLSFVVFAGHGVNALLHWSKNPMESIQSVS